ncbi:MFS transporter [Photobacterium sanctipauli]|uniref:MFS transporter n=1 Tax=Photobacterium sanctipauli TaxID=1342794 RepID=A0A2T3NNJ8_9GAMM|nr:MFS transporter [Photobacterium sanctipauli]PSW17226.1 MFS transporter [Photobacterium sanctipauli]
MRNKTTPYLSGRFFDGISSGLFMMALPWLMLKTPDMGTFVALTALACTSNSFLCTPFFSTLIDRHSRKAILVWVQVLQSSTAAVVGIIYLLGVGSHWVLAFSQLVFWVSSNIAWNTNNAFTQENYRSHEYAKISGYQEVVMQTTTLGAGAVGIILLEQWGILEFAAFAALASGLAALSYGLTPYNRQVKPSSKVSFFSQIKESKAIFTAEPVFYGFLLISCLSYPILTYLGKLIPIWFAELDVSGSWVALYNMAFGLGSLVTGLLISRIIGRISHENIMQYSMLVLAFILLAMSGVVQPLYIVLLTLSFGFFNALNRIARTNWMHHTVDMAQRGRVDGGLGMFATLVQSLSYVLIAFLAHFDAIEYGFVIVGVIVLFASIGMIAMSKKLPLSCNPNQKPKPNQEPNLDQSHQQTDSALTTQH